MNQLKQLLRPLVIALLEPAEDRAAHLKKRLRLPKRFILRVVEYVGKCDGQLDEALLIHQLSKVLHDLQRGDNRPFHSQAILDLLDWLGDNEDRLEKIKSPAPAMQPAPHDWPVPAITTVGGLATFLNISVTELEALADLRRLQDQIPQGKGQHYRYRWVSKMRGKQRLLEIPKKRLKTVQYTILTTILNLVPPHAATHGFRQGRSIVTNAEPHLKQEVVVSFDLADFFPSVHFNQVMAIFRRIGYPRTIARYLAAICTKATPYEVWQQHPQNQSQPNHWQKMSLFRERHLPQGAPSSPALANLAAYHLDLRLQTLAQSQGWHYTRYADDMTLSGNRALVRSRLSLMTLVASIVESEGFRINLKKTHVMHLSQRQEVCGVVVNVKPNVRRCEYDQLKAILYNCIRNGPDSENRQNHPHFQEHLRGRIAVLSQFHPSRGAKMLSLWQQITW